MNPPTPAEPVLAACVACEGRDADGCAACGGSGTFRVEGCPCVFAADAGLACMAADQAERGNWPGGVGWAREPARTVSAVRAVWADTAVEQAAAAESAARRAGGGFGAHGAGG